MRGREKFLYLLADRWFYEPIERYNPLESDFKALVQQLLPETWAMRRRHMWFSVGRSTTSFPRQGWKLHLSTIPSTARDLLATVVPVLIRDNAPFKFICDMKLLLIANGKNFGRGSSGKFITIYPSDINHFYHLASALDDVTRTFDGPHILSDAPVKDSRVLFYRYGGFSEFKGTDIKGSRKSLLLDPRGKHFEDQRRPEFIVPEWVEDPFKSYQNRDSTTSVKAAPVLADGRFEIQSVLGFKNSGGIYLARDCLSNTTVIAKEARQNVGWLNLRTDAVSLLKKEYKILSGIAPLAVGPRPIALFQEWKHWFLVEEQLDSYSIIEHSAACNVLLRAVISENELQTFCRRWLELFADLADLIAKLHSVNIVFGDLAPDNVRVLNSTGEVRLLDFEAAFQEGVDEPTGIVTAGFAETNEKGGTNPVLKRSGDLFGLASLMIAYLWPVNILYSLVPSRREQVFDVLAEELGLSIDLAKYIQQLLSSSSGDLPCAADVAIRLREFSACEVLPKSLAERSRLAIQKGPEPSRIVNFIRAQAAPGRKDRVFPADPQVFETNPLGVAFGMSGIVYALQIVTGKSDPELVALLVSRLEQAETLPPGLYLGAGGIAWVLYELGMAEPATKLLKGFTADEELFSCVDIFYGAAGWGMANLKAFLETQDELFLERAISAADEILNRGNTDQGRLYWSDSGRVSLGYAHGGAGVATFLLYLFLVTGRSRYIENGEAALAFELANAVRTPDGGLAWPETTKHRAIYLPYWRYGSAGVASALWRYISVTGSTEYRSILASIKLNIAKRYSVFPGLFSGLAGLGMALLELHDFDADESARRAAFTIAETLKLFAIERPEGTAFPGESLHRLSCDYGTGSAGVALYLHRLTTRFPTPFMLDGLLPSNNLLRGYRGEQETAR